MKYFNIIFWVGALIGIVITFFVFREVYFINNNKNEPQNDILQTYKPRISSSLLGIYDLVKDKNGLREKIKEFGSVDSIIKFNIPPMYKVDILNNDTSNLKLIIRDQDCIDRFIVLLSNNVVSDYANAHMDSIISKCAKEKYIKNE